MLRRILHASVCVSLVAPHSLRTRSPTDRPDQAVVTLILRAIVPSVIQEYSWYI